MIKKHKQVGSQILELTEANDTASVGDTVYFYDGHLDSDFTQIEGQGEIIAIEDAMFLIEFDGFNSKDDPVRARAWFSGVAQ